MKAVLPFATVMLSILGIADAGYITYEKFTGVIPKCIPGFECGKVLTSPWSSIGPVPLSLLGLIYYFCVLLIASLVILEVDIHKLLPTLPSFLTKLTTFDFLWLLTIFGFAFSLYLIFIMGVVIQGWCTYCLVSAATCTLLFASTSLNKFLNREKTS